MFIYQHPTDNVAGNGTVTVSTEDAAYPKANLYDRNPAKPFRFTQPSGFVLWDFVTPQQVDGIALIHHNLQDLLPGVRIQANSGNTWTTPPLNETISIDFKDEDGFTRSPWKDLTAIGARTWRFWRFIVESANVANVAIGELWLSAQRRLLPNDVDWPVGDLVNRPGIEHKTDYLVSTIYDFGVKQRTFDGTSKLTPSGRAVVKKYWDACRGRALPHLIVPFPERNEAFMVQWLEMTRNDQEEFQGYVVIQMAWQEKSRGLVL